MKNSMNTYLFNVLVAKIDGLDVQIDGLDKRIDRLEHRVSRQFSLAVWYWF